jgi:hypothetical protein
MAFAQIDPPAGNEISLRGTFHNLTLTIHATPGEDPMFAWELKPSDAPIRERLAALDFLYAMSGQGEIEWISVEPEFPPLSLETELDEFDRDLLGDRKLFEDLVLIEDYLEVRFDLPEKIDLDGLSAIRTAAQTIRTGEATILVSNVTFEFTAGALDAGEEIELTAPLPVEIPLLGGQLFLGLADGELRARVASVERQGESDHVTLVPRDEEARRVHVSGLRRMPPAPGA